MKGKDVKKKLKKNEKKGEKKTGRQIIVNSLFFFKTAVKDLFR